MANPLSSKLFTKDPAVRARLTDCLNRDSAHIFQSPTQRGPHVSAIQSALFLVMPEGTGISNQELNDAHYGDTTARAVKKYKILRGIKRSWQTDIDDIVGIMTIDRLDTEVKQKEPPSDDPPVPPPDPFRVDNFKFLPLNGPILIKHQDDDLGKQDLEDSPVDRTFAKAKATRLLQGVFGFDTVDEANCKAKLRDITAKGGPHAQDMAEFFFKNTIRPGATTARIFSNSSFFTGLIKKDGAFLQNHVGLSLAIKAGLQQLASASTGKPKVVDPNLLLEGSGQPSKLNEFQNHISFAFQEDPGRALRGDPLAFAIGGIQGVKITISSFQGSPDGSYTGTLDYVLFDHYGSDDGDVIDPGQAGLWMLQRKMVKGQGLFGFEPYRVAIFVENVEFSGDLGTERSSVRTASTSAFLPVRRHPIFVRL